MVGAVGGQFRLTCGGIGTGKSYLNVKEAEFAKKSGKYKKIYSNIRAHAELADGITPFPDDWRECEEDSLLIIDEVQKHEKFSKHFSNRRDSEIVDLTMIRHKRQDIWMISPNATLVNADVRALVNQYYHLEPNGKKTTKCFCFDKVKLNVTKAVKNQAYDEFTYTIEPDKYGKLYKTTEDGVASGRTYNTNMKLIGFIIGALITCSLIAGLVYWLAKGANDDVQAIQEQETKNFKKDNTKDIADQTTNKLTENDCRKGVNIDKPECVEYFDNLTKNNLSVRDESIQYDHANPYDQEIYKDKISYEVTAKPLFSGCVKKDGKFIAYTQQGTKIHNIHPSACKRLIEDADRPFNYYAEKATEQAKTELAAKTEDKKMTPDQYAKYLQYLESQQSNNYVQSHLDHNPINGSNSL